MHQMRSTYVARIRRYGTSVITSAGCGYQFYGPQSFSAVHSKKFQIYPGSKKNVNTVEKCLLYRKFLSVIVSIVTVYRSFIALLLGFLFGFEIFCNPECIIKL